MSIEKKNIESAERIPENSIRVVYSENPSYIRIDWNFNASYLSCLENGTLADYWYVNTGQIGWYDPKSDTMLIFGTLPNIKNGLHFGKSVPSFATSSHARYITKHTLTVWCGFRHISTSKLDIGFVSTLLDIPQIRRIKSAVVNFSEHFTNKYFRKEHTEQSYPIDYLYRSLKEFRDKCKKEPVAKSISEPNIEPTTDQTTVEQTTEQAGKEDMYECDTHGLVKRIPVTTVLWYNPENDRSTLITTPCPDCIINAEKEKEAIYKKYKDFDKNKLSPPPNLFKGGRGWNKNFGIWEL